MRFDRRSFPEGGFLTAPLLARGAIAQQAAWSACSSPRCRQNSERLRRNAR